MLLASVWLTGCGATATAPTASRTLAARQVAARGGLSASRESKRERLLRGRLSDTLTDAITAADSLGGHASVALWLDGWSTPIVAGADPWAYGRMWSMSKPVAAIAAYEAAEEQDHTLTPALVTAMTDAITRSDNCGERRVILGIQQMTGGLAGTLSTFDGVLAQAGVTPSQTPQRDGLSEPTCLPYLQKRAPTATPDAVAWQFGTERWTVRQAVAFSHALAIGAYGRAGKFVLGLMATPKQPELAALEGPSGDHIANLQWGAGSAFAPWHPAYKPGWGGSQQHDFLAGQIVVLQDAHPSVALAAMFRPTVEPLDDDVGATAAPQALEALFGRIREALVEADVLQRTDP